MSTEFEETKEHRGSNAVSMTSFFGGRERGRCLQLTQTGMGYGEGHNPCQMVQMTETQVRETMATMKEWLEA